MSGDIVIESAVIIHKMKNVQDAIDDLINALHEPDTDSIAEMKTWARFVYEDRLKYNPDTKGNYTAIEAFNSLMHEGNIQIDKIDKIARKWLK